MIIFFLNVLNFSLLALFHCFSFNTPFFRGEIPFTSHSDFMKAIFFVLLNIFLLSKLTNFSRRRVKELMDKISILFVFFGKEILEDIFFQLPLVRVCQDIPIVQMLMICIKFEEKGLKKFFITEQDVFYILLIQNKVLRRNQGDSFPNVEVKRSRECLFDHDV